jgi:hypothetical protein
MFLLVVVFDKINIAINTARPTSKSDKRRPVSKQQQGEQHGQRPA